MTHMIYRFFDGDGAILYIGRTKSIGNRLMSHALEKQWWPEVARIEAHAVPAIDVAAAEVDLIRAESPRHNVIGVGQRQSQAVRRGMRKGFEGIRAFDSPGAMDAAIRWDNVRRVRGEMPLRVWSVDSALRVGGVPLGAEGFDFSEATGVDRQTVRKALGKK